MQYRQQQFQIRSGGIMGFVMLIAFLVLLFVIARSIFKILAWASPILIILAVIIRYRTVLDFLKYLWLLLRRNPLMGVLAIILCIVGFPVVSAFLFGKAILDRRIDRYTEAVRKHHEGELTEYVDVTHLNEETLDLEAPPSTVPRNTYDDLFSDDAERK